ncbi:MAG: ABC transporter permease [Saprospiraceae bacterium]|nr:ABC transporter permease [Saprospiraceae bacterium]
MNTAISYFSRSIVAETFKLKRTPLLWIALIGGIFVSGFVFLIYVFSVENLGNVKGNPWNLYFRFGFTMISLLFAMPYIVLVTSSITYFEHNSNTWKFLYTLPLQKGNFYFSKLFVVISLIAVTYIVYFISLFITGYLLDFIRPVYGFQKTAPDFVWFISTLGHSYLSLLGITSLHYWMSIRWKNFILPMSIGLLGFIIAVFILLAKKYDMAIYFPYAYAGLVGLELGPHNEPTGMLQFWKLTSAEWLSLACFVVFTFVGFWEEKKSNVK